MHTKFHDFGISDKTLISLSEMGFEEPTPIQKAAIPKVLEGLDIIGQAQTGTGKTAAFGIPMIEKRPDEKSRHPYALVLVPTRELAIQVSNEISKMGNGGGVLALPVYGGQSIDSQIKNLRRGVDIVVGTPGRLIDHITRKTISLSCINTLVLDEADEMLNMGFKDDIESILKEVPEERQTMLFSATMPREILAIAKNYMRKPVHVSVDAGDIVVTKIKQVFYEVREENKINALSRLLDVEDPALTIIFCHTKREVDDVAARLQQMGYPVGAIHGDFTQSHRDDMMKRFKSGEIDVLVATDVAARGLDIPEVSHVINFSVPQDPEGYVHRIGRTGRAGKSGIAITFVTPRQYHQLRLIEKYAKTNLQKAKLPTTDEVKKAKEDGLADKIAKIIEEGQCKNFYPLAERLFNAHKPEDVLASLCSMILITDEGAKEAAAGGSKGDFVRLFLTIGKKDNIRVTDIVRYISSETNIPAEKIINISILDKFSFVEVPAELADMVIHAIDNSFVKGRKVKIQHAKGRDDTSRDSDRDHHRRDTRRRPSYN